ncbi:biotin--[acetyl-CoA-carboxylase] ligase [Flavobacterium sp.]|uniref:biotin--[acetyl-CoA-carboxylase] ligase n=1 Tax=Flavobacterium sp. TaxID=239 RepID=UPI00286A3344|nr:biotin--[acetyl-CoA-carboxylase] ligase [Flavobacterium sp.]
MNLIKLDAIHSTNDYLKELSQQKNLENFTVVTAKSQTHGKGQMGAVWDSESDKNLILSILIKDVVFNINTIFNLNVIISVSVINALNSLKISNLNIKWPNDILAENKKIAGILIENSIKENGTIESIVGIGLNVNQTNFQNLPKASSLKNIMNKDFEINIILENIVFKIEQNVEKLKNKNIEFFWNEYENYLFRKGKPTVFENVNQDRFMGIISGVSSNGQLEILLEDDTTKQFGLKEITMIY